MGFVAQPVMAATQLSVDAGYQQLEAFMHDLNTLQTSFVQSVYDDHGQLVEHSSGTLLLQRPNQFRWEYLKPHTQLIVADGYNLWVYDQDLAQASVRRLDQGLAGTPAILLSGDAGLRRDFTVTTVEQDHGGLLITLVPKRDDTDFKQIRLMLQKQQLKSMELADKLERTTVLEFSRSKRNVALAQTQFTFTPPTGVDVIGTAMVVPAQ